MEALKKKMRQAKVDIENIKDDNEQLVKQINEEVQRREKVSFPSYFRTTWAHDRI